MKTVSLLLLTTASLFAGTAVNNGVPNNVESYGISASRAADDFTLTKTTTISSIRFWWGPTTGGQVSDFSGVISYIIYQNDGGALGASVTGGTVSGITSTPTGAFRSTCGGPPNCPQQVAEFNLIFPVSLAPGTYWLELHEGDSVATNDGTSTFWATSAAAGNAKHCTFCLTTPTVNIGVELAFQLFDTRVPEPGSFSFNANWKYLVTAADQGSAWRNTGFNDSAWPTGFGRIGYGDVENTTIGFGPDPNNKYNTTYFRRTFNVADPAQIGSVLISLVKDDGAVVYLNGTEVGRSNMPSGAVTYSTLAVNALSGDDETSSTTFGANPSLLVAGNNVIAVEVHQSGGTSSDLGFDMKLSLGQCFATLNPTSLNLSNTNQTTTVNVSAPGSCRWRATHAGSLPWMAALNASNIFTADGQGNGAIQITVQPNTTQFPRTASINVNGNLVQVLQRGTNVTQLFGDVPATHVFFGHVTEMAQFGVSSGCAPLTFCVDQVTTRGKMAELVIKAKFGENFTFNPVPLFTDVPTSHPQFKYIQKMKELGITAGCTTTQYCPELQVTRGQVAVFLVRGKFDVVLESEFAFNPNAYFTDVPANHIFFPYIQKLKDQGFTAGCTLNTYCPDGQNTLGQISVFLIRAFFAP